MPHFSAKRLFLRSLIWSLSLSTGGAVLIFLFGEFGETEARLLATAFAISGYSMTGLCGSLLVDRHRYTRLGLAGMIISAFSLFLTTVVIWDIAQAVDDGKVIATCFILSFAIAHISLLLLADAGSRVVMMVRNATVVAVSIVAAIMTFIVIAEPHDQGINMYYRLLGVFAVLSVLGTILVLILKKFGREAEICPRISSTGRPKIYFENDAAAVASASPVGIDTYLHDAAKRDLGENVDDGGRLGRVRLSEQVKSVIEGNPVVVGTVMPDNRPNVVTVSAVKVVGDDLLLITDNYMGQTVQDISRNKNVCLAVWGADQAGYKLVGEAEYFASGAWKSRVEQLEENRGLPAKGAIVVKITKVIPSK